MSVKEARIQCIEAFESRKQVDFLKGAHEQDTYKSKRMIYRSAIRDRSAMRDFLNETANTRVQKLSFAADNDEKTFWRLIKGQRCCSQMSAFLVNGELITDKNKSVICGLITILALFPVTQIMITIFSIKLQHL